MSNPYIGEIRMFAGNFAPQGWLFCQGQIVAISDYDTLFNLIGTTYGGDGQDTFALPNLSSRFPVHQGGGYSPGQVGGQETVQLTANQLPVHNHTPAGSANSNSENAPSGNVSGLSPLAGYTASAPNTSMATGTLAATGGNQAHDNMPPYLVINYIISMYGIYPSPT